jgi:hypothetical protein
MPRLMNLKEDSQFKVPRFGEYGSRHDCLELLARPDVPQHPETANNAKC